MNELTIDLLVAAMAKRCGLQDPDAFAKNGGIWAKHSDLPNMSALLKSGRGRGRTTRMLLSALVAADARVVPIGILGYCPDQLPYLKECLDKLAKICGVDVDCVQFWPADLRRMAEPNVALLLSDHTVEEGLASKVLSEKSDEHAEADTAPPDPDMVEQPWSSLRDLGNPNG